MKRSLFIIFFVATSPLYCLAQLAITGRVLSAADNRPIINASVFLSNATTGGKTDTDGIFTLHNTRPGKYELVVSSVGFKTYIETIIVGANIALSDIMLSPRAIALKEVTIKPHNDPNRDKYYNWFRDQFLGTSALAEECRILNPEVLDFDYDERTLTLKASSYDFLEIENDALGYKIKYLLNDFVLEAKDPRAVKISYQGPFSFEELSGSPADERRWKKKREEVYRNSPMHFMRAAIANRLYEDGFRVQKFVALINPERGPDSLVSTKIKFYTGSKANKPSSRDSLAYWVRRSKLPRTIQKLLPDTLIRQDIIRPGDRPGKYEFIGGAEGMLVAYNKGHHYHIDNKFKYLDNPANGDNTLIKFNSQDLSFYANGVLADSYALVSYGVWARRRVAELLPQDYNAGQYMSAVTDSTDAINAVVNKLRAFSTIHQAEKAYLQFDKPYYAAGDTIYFKAYLASGERREPSAISGVLHVELIGPDSKIGQSIKLQVAHGVAWGDFALPDTLAPGNYRVRAYTRWMLNDGAGAFFEEILPVGSLRHTIASGNGRIPENAVPGSRAGLKADISFLPEGGTMVNGIRSKVAFKAVGAGGLGVPVKGVVMDSDNKEISNFASAHLGMGYFYLSPQEGKTYRAKLTYADGSDSTIDLPKAEEKGIVLTVNNDSIATAPVRIEVSKALYQEKKNEEYNLLIWSGGKAITVPCKLDSTVITMDILKRKLHTGISTITLFSPENEPLCERLIFVQNYDQLNLNVNTDKSSYNKRDKVNISLLAKNRADSLVSGHFSVSVTDESKVPADENAETTILSSLLLTSDLKGHIEQPNYYLNNISDKKLGELDLVMLTNGYRRFQWKQLLQNAYPPLAYQPENLLTIKGIATTPGGRVIDNGTVSLISPQGGPVLSAKTDENGNFAFHNLAFADSTKFILQAVNARGRDNTQIIYKVEKDDVPVMGQAYATRTLTEQQLQADTALQTYMQNSEKRQEELNRLGKGTGRYLSGVTIKDKKKIKDVSISLVPEAAADEVIHGDQIAYGGTLSTRLMILLHKVTWVPDGAFFKPGKMLVIVDGAVGTVDQVSTDDVAAVEVLNPPNSYIYGQAGLYGALIITTKHAVGQVDTLRSHKVRSLREVKIKGVKRNDNYPSSSLAGPGHADQVMHASEIEKIQGQLSTSLDGRLLGVRFAGPPGAKIACFLMGPMLLVVDGVEMPPGTSVDDYNVNSIETVEVLRFASASIYGMNGGNGVLVITTKQGGSNRDTTNLHKVRALREVKIKGVKANDNYISSNIGGAGHADQVVRRSDFHGGGQFSDMFNGILRGVTFVGQPGEKTAYLTMNLTTGMGSSPMTLVVDGVVMPSGTPVDSFNPNSIETIEVLKYSGTAMYGSAGGSGVLLITTRKGGQQGFNLVSTGFLPVTVPGFYKAREFYSPKYDVPASNATRDLRTTIFWKPDVVTDKSGHVSFDYYNSDGPGTYRVVVEGMDEKGNIGRKVYRYKVE